MGTLFSGVGLSTGLDITSLVDQLIAASSAPRDQLLSRIGNIDAQRTGILDVSARISAMLSNLTTLKQETTFRSSAVNVSDESVLSVTTSSRAEPGSYDFLVRQLATRHQQVSRGFNSRDQRLTTGSIRVESAQARVNADTDLDTLNGYRGVQRGTFQIEDAAGNKASIDLSDAVTVNDVIDRINDAGLDVRARVRGDSIEITETTGGVVRVAEENGGTVAADLGFDAGNTASDLDGAADQLLGGGLMALSAHTPLGELNEGSGVRTGRGGGDFTVNGATIDLSAIVKPETRLAQLNGGNGVDLGRIEISTYTEAGSEIPHEIDLTGLVTVGDIKAAIESAVPDVSVTLSSSRLVVNYRETDSDDEDAEPRRLKITDLDGRAARDLGIAGDAEAGRINGNDILSMNNVGDVLAAINHAAENDGSFSASIDGTRLVIDAGGAAIGLEALGDAQALADLGFEAGGYREPVSSARLVSGINTTLVTALNGGRGLDTGQIEITVGEGAAAETLQVDLTDVETFEEIVQAINDAAESAGLAISAGYDRTGTRLALRSDDRTTPIAVADVQGAGKLAAQLGLVGQSGAELLSDDLERQYISETTLLEDLNGGRGVGLGEIRITNSDGLLADFDLRSAETIGDVIDQINSRQLAGGVPFGVTARINDTGDGIVIEDGSDGTLSLQIEDLSGTAAEDLRIAGTAEANSLDGSFELNIEVSGSDTLEDLVRRINEESGIATASLLNDGSAVNPFRLQITSDQTGRAGELLVEDVGLDLGLTNLSRPQDAVVVVGGSGGGGLVVTSASNTINEIAPGLSLDLTDASDEAVSVTITRDDDLIVEQVEGLVSAFNTAVERIDELTDYNAETETSGVLLGDSTLASIERRLFSRIIGNVAGSPGGIRRLSDLGVKVEGGSLTLDTQKLRDRLNEDPEGVLAFFTDPDNGFAVVMQEEVDALVESDGLLDRRTDTLDNQRTALNDRVESMNDLLDRKRERLTREFLAMESAVAELQSQQSAISQLGALAAGTGQ